MTLWIIEPRDPLIVRDGRPFGPNPGARAATLPFPFPATVAGGLRHKAGMDADGAFGTTDANSDFVKTLAMRGPLLVRLNNGDDSIAEWLPPAPADALILDREPADEAVCVQQLAPRTLTATSSLPTGLQLIGPRAPVSNKASAATPRFWHWQAFEQWLAAPADDDARPRAELGLGHLETDTRLHVSVQSATQTAIDGALFQTQGLVFTGSDRARLALAAAFDGETPHFKEGGLAPLGGERRLMRWIPSTQTALPTVAQTLREHIIRERRARVVLLTPACFAEGFRPAFDWVRDGATATLEAALVQRAQVISGWDMHALNASGRRGQPKATRRLAPAGSVYFITWQEDQDVAAWLNATWMQNVSDELQDQRDGFGLAVYGVWPQEEGQR